MTYLEDAAAELAKARDDNEKRAAFAAELDEMKRPDQAADVRREVNARRMEIAAGFAVLAAIEAGLPPAYPSHPQLGPS